MLPISSTHIGAHIHILAGFNFNTQIQKQAHIVVSLCVFVCKYIIHLSDPRDVV